MRCVAWYLKVVNGKLRLNMIVFYTKTDLLGVVFGACMSAVDKYIFCQFVSNRFCH